jgi:hypothetical protein
MTQIVQPQGWQQQVGLGLESPWGTVAPLTQWVPAKDSIKYDPGIKHVPLAIGGRGRRITTVRGIRVAGGLEVQCCPGRLMELMSLLTMPAPDIDPNAFHSSTVQAIHSPDIVKTYLGVRAANFRLRNEISGDEGGGDLTATLDCIARNMDPESALGTPNYDDTPASFTAHELLIMVDDSEEVARRSVEVAWNLMLQGDKWGDERLLRELPSGGQEIDIDLGLDLEDTVWIDRFYNQTEFPVSLTWTRGVNSLLIEFPRCVIMDGADPQGVDRGSRMLLAPKIAALEDVDGSPEYQITVDGTPLEGEAGYYYGE